MMAFPLSPILSRLGAIVLLGSLLAVGGCGGPTILPDADNLTSPVILDENAAAAAISRYRASHGLGPVVLDSSLIRAASYQAESNARAGKLSHEIGGTFDSRMARAGFGRSFAAENLSAGSNTFDEVLARWKASSEHNKNMLMPQLKRIGIARVDAPGTRYKRFWALVLAGN
ncbi:MULTISPECIES: CAP domain-containing protein [unclassified Methylobacterium]|uniref:CAP domain-containing protein n=1 Tax=unclassified Methylobacterium TaxID=2615210 RepID=UPI0006F9409D|nr:MULTISPECIES: CAP domain-containing protein [unclassified Methylobacterium]KQO52043.1 serine protease [Methylobacterium sp. Leaf86]KQO90430.1 serine protease [Methylobacterium sp. Leaf91]